MKNIEDKIRDLLAKATDPSASEAEAEGAMRMAQKLMFKHDLSEDDIKERGAAAFTMHKHDGKKTKFGTAFHPIDKYLGTYIALFCGCVRWNQRGDSEDAPDKCVYFGTDADVEFALYLRGAWMKHFDYNWEVYKASNPRVRDMVAARQSFSHGFAMEMRDRLDGWGGMKDDAPHKGLDTHNKLVAVRLDLVSDEMKRLGIVLGHGRGTRSYGKNEAANGAGKMAARSAGVGRGVNRGSIKAIGSS